MDPNTKEVKPEEVSVITPIPPVFESKIKKIFIFWVIGLVVIIIGFFICQKYIKETTIDIKNDVVNIDKYIGTYEYIYPDNTEDLIENQYIIIDKKDSKYFGLYYGTTDEFDETREGYLPGFFVAPMDNLEINNDTIKFTLSVDDKDFFEKPIDRDIKSTEEAFKAGYENWGVKMNKKFSKKYSGVIKDNGQIFFKGQEDFLDKTFIKKI